MNELRFHAKFEAGVLILIYLENEQDKGSRDTLF